MSKFKIEGMSLGGESNGTSLQGYLTASYINLVALLGEPNCCGDEYKVSTEWVLTYGGRVFTIYDYKVTNLYDHSDAPSVEQFRAQKSYDWHIGAHDKKGVDEFVAAIATAIAFNFS